MPNGGQPPGTASLYDNTIYDEHGKPILQITSGQYIVTEPDGTMTSRSISSMFPLVCGLSWSPLEAARKDNPIRIGICPLCRHPPYRFPIRPKPRHGLVSMRRAKRCVSCGRLICPQHRKMGADGQWRCTGCSRWYRLRTALLGLFFRYEEN